MENKSLKVVKDKLSEYGINILREDFNKNEYSIVCENMVLFLKNKVLSVALQATTKPDLAAKYIIILSETELRLDIMEAFIFDEDNNIVSGENAYELIHKTEEERIVKSFVKEQVLKEMLIECECHKC